MNRLVYYMVLLMVLVLTAGCTPETWPVFESRYLATQAARTVDMPDTLRPPLPPQASLSGKKPLDLSIEEAAMLALSRNRDLQVHQLNPVIAGTFEQIQRGRFDPEFFAQFEYNQERTTETSKATGEQYAVDGKDSGFVTGIRQTLPTGTTIEASMDHEKNLSNRTPEEQSFRMGVSLTQSLLQGFGPTVNLVRVQQAEMDTSVSLYELRGFVEAMLAQTEIAYWNLVLAGKEITIVEQSLAIAAQQLDEVEQQISVGLLPEVEAAAARAEVAHREQALIDARSLMESYRLKLLRQINPTPEDGFDLPINVTSDPVIQPVPLEDLVDRLKLARRSRPDLNEARLRLKQNRLETIGTRNGLLPRLELFAVLGQTGYADSFSDSFRHLDDNTYDFSLGLRFVHSLGNRTAKAVDLAARSSRQKAEQAVVNLDQSVQLDVRLAINEVARTLQQITASRATRSLQKLTLTAERERFKVGSSTSMLIAQAQRNLLASEIAEVLSIVHYRIALVRLYLAEGTLLERRGVECQNNRAAIF